MKKFAHYIFIILSIFLMAGAFLPAFIIWVIFRENVMERIYWWCSDFERKYFDK